MQIQILCNKNNKTRKFMLLYFRWMYIDIKY